ncbi:MAG: hypothetical protein EA427_07755 [Spirochaetaceae bacterium]|nr:MAG: hypothetical protein EA427_07755 [Spirochaetaceae bacterium]
MTDLYDRLRRIRERKSDGGGRGVRDRSPGTDWDRACPGVYRRTRDMVLPARFGEQIDDHGGWIGISSLFRVGECLTPLFLDVETSGLSGGSGSVAFLVGLGRLRRREEGVLVRVEQFFLSDLGAESEFTALLHETIESAGGAGTPAPPAYVTYNGAGFDLPVLRTRAILARRSFPEYLHLDLLPPTRRLYSPVIGSCRLTAVERRVLCLERENDIPGSEVPERYLRFIRTGQTRDLSPVMDHHLQDIAHLAFLGLHLNDTILRYPEQDSREDRAGAGPDEAGLLRMLLERGSPGERVRAEEILYHRVYDKPPRDGVEWISIARLHALVARRRNDWNELCRTLQLIRGQGGTLQDAVDLAIQLEHRSRDYIAALSVVREAGEQFGWDAALRHREARLNRRINRSA